MAAKYALQSFFGSNRDELLAHIPHACALGMQVIDVGPCFSVLKMPFRAELVGDPVRGVPFGGVITTLLDQALGLAVSCSLERIIAIATLDLRIDYLRAAEPGRDLVGHAECYRVTKHVAFARGTAYDREPSDPFATCVATFMIGANASFNPFSTAAEERKTGSTDDQ